MPAQTPAMRYCSGSALFECEGDVEHGEVVGHERHDERRERQHREAQDHRRGRASAIQSARWRSVPASGTTPSASAVARASQSAEVAEFGDHGRAP